MSRVESPAAAKWTALVVDDDPGVQAFFETLLARDGFSVDLARNGNQAFEYLRRGCYSVILLDLMMPEVNGFELLERLARESPMLLRRVIVMSGASQRMVDLIDGRRVWGVVRKPFDIHDLVRSAKECASGRPRAMAAVDARPEQRA